MPDASKHTKHVHRLQVQQSRHEVAAICTSTPFSNTQRLISDCQVSNKPMTNPHKHMCCAKWQRNWLHKIPMTDVVFMYNVIVSDKQNRTDILK